MSTSEKPVIVLVHGAWQRPLHYTSLIYPLRADGYTVVTPLNATAGRDESIDGKTHLDDVKNVHSAIEPYLDAGREIVLVCHSFGGVVGTASAEGYTVAERKKKGEKGGIKAIIFIAAFALPQKGVSLFDAIGNVKPDWWDFEGERILAYEHGPSMLYNGIDESVAEMCGASLVMQSKASFMTPTTYTAAEVNASKVYVACELDRAVPFEVQIAMAQAAGARIEKVPTGHSPFLKEPETTRLLEIIKETAAEVSQV